MGNGRRAVNKMTLIYLIATFLVVISSTVANETAEVDIKSYHAKDGLSEERILWIDVERTNNKANQVIEKTKVRLDIEVKKYNVFINGFRIDHHVVSRLHTTAKTMRLNGTLWEEGPPAFVHVRVLVVEGPVTGLTRVFTVEEQIVFIDDQEYVQVDVKQVEIEMNEEVELRRVC